MSKELLKEVLEANVISLTLHPWLFTSFLFCEVNFELHVQNSLCINWLLWRSGCTKMEQRRSPANASLNQVSIFSIFQNDNILKPDSWFLDDILVLENIYLPKLSRKGNVSKKYFDNMLRFSCPKSSYGK